MTGQGRRQLEAALAAARATVAALEAALAAASATEQSSLLDARQALAEYGIGRDGLLAAAARGELRLTRGPRRKILVSRDALEEWCRSRPVRPTPRQRADVESLDDWDLEATRQLRAIEG